MPEITARARWHIDAGRPQFFVDYFNWMRRGRGYAAVHRFLAEHDLRNWHPNRPPMLTRTKQQAKAISRGGDTTISRAIDRLGSPAIFFECELRDMAERRTDAGTFVDADLQYALRGNRYAWQIEDAGYVRFPHPAGRKWEVLLTHTFAGVGGQAAARTVWRKKSAAAYVRRAVWQQADGELTVRYLDAWLRRLALGGPGEAGGSIDGVDPWVDPRGVRWPNLPVLPGADEDRLLVEETAAAGAQDAAANSLEARAQALLRAAAEVRRQAGQLPLTPPADDDADSPADTPEEPMPL